jgi:hypothetical protein
MESEWKKRRAVLISSVSPNKEESTRRSRQGGVERPEDVLADVIPDIRHQVSTKLDASSLGRASFLQNGNIEMPWSAPRASADQGKRAEEMYSKRSGLTRKGIWEDDVNDTAWLASS